MRSNVDFWLNRIDEEKTKRLKASGIVLTNGIKDSIRDQGLIDTSRMINDIQYQPERPKREVHVGSTISDPWEDWPYPKLLNNSFRHHITEEIVGPYRFMEKGTTASEEALRAIWRQEIR